MKNEEDNECISKFGHYCLLFYSSSLILNSSTSSLNNEEKKANTSNDKKKDQAVGKILIEALDRINTIHSMLQQQQQHSDAITSSIANLKQEHTIISKQYHEILLECGLLDINQFIESSSSGIRYNDTPSLLQRYNQMRDSMRQRAHQISSLHRQNSLFELLSSTSSSFSSSLEKEEDKPRLTQIENIQHTISIIQKFVNKYKANTGSHSFIAGLYKFIDLQINPKPDSKRFDPEYIVRWTFNGSVLTESCRSCIGKHNENESDELAYAREAIEVLFSFLIWIKDDIDLEGGVVNMMMKPIDIHDLGQLESMDSSTYNKEPMLSFEVDKNVSNYTLKRILSVLPNPKRLDARATGSLEVVSSVNLSCQRTNIEGKEDEHSWFGMMIRYFLEYFHII